MAVPTETVYGLLARADRPAALASLVALKGRDPKLAFTWHVANARPLEHFRALNPLAQRLAERYWPGPLSLVLKGVPTGLEGVARGGWTGLRWPAHGGLSLLIDALDFPVVATSANRTGAAPATTPEEVARIFGDQVGLILDGGPCRLGEPSGVLKLGPGHFELLREGLLTLGALRRTAGRRIGFVCTGNTCRSPMAEALARKELSRRLGLELSPAPPGAGAKSIRDFGFEVSSMGVSAGVGAPASPLAVAVLAELKIDLTGHLSRPALPADVLALDEVYCLTRSHLEMLRSSLPPGDDRTLELLDPAGEDIPDPYGAARWAYVKARDAIRSAIEQRAPSWA